ncbi:hypothetical protein H8A92_33145, partial [Bradyrhizobium sp. 10BB]|nr:hypothetical protein [Bradyrhizobium acaciae]
MRQVILDARVADLRVKSGQVPFHARTKRPAAPLWFAATLVVTCLLDAPGSGGAAHAQSNGIAGSSQQLAQANTNPAGGTGPAAQQEQSADALARELAKARQDIELLQGLLTKERENSVQVENALQGEAEKLRKSLKEVPQGSAGELQRALREERGRTAQLEQDLAVARLDVDKLAVLLVKANDETAKLKQASQDGKTDLRKPLEQEHERAAKLEKDLATARRDVETQSALAAKANDEAAKLKQAAQSGAADLQKSLEQEHERAAKLEKDLATARRDVETQSALAAKASDEAAKLKQASQSGAADLQKSLAQE